MVLVFGSAATPTGPMPTGMVAVTVLVLPLGTDTVVRARVATEVVCAVGCTGTLVGISPRGMVAVTVQPLPLWAMPLREDADTAAAVATGASPVMARVVRHAAR